MFLPSSALLYYEVPDYVPSKDGLDRDTTDLAKALTYFDFEMTIPLCLSP
jgi:hypothetical protein